MPNTHDNAAWKRELEFSAGGDITEGLRRISAALDDMDDFLSGVPGLDAAGRADLRLVSDEIGSNVVRYGTGTSDVRFSVCIHLRADAVVLRIADNGEEFNPFTVDIPYMGNDLDKRRVGGLGLYLISQLFPLATYERRDGCNISEVVYCLGADGKRRMRRTAGRWQCVE